MIKMKYYSYFCMIAVLINASCLRQEEVSITTDSKEVELDIIKEVNMETIVLGGGCFWCTEAVFEKLDGIKDVISGYAGGEILNPTYKQICTGNTGHAEVIKIKFDPSVISFTKILDIFGDCHDPTTLNRQGADVGTQYRSTIMYLSEKQKELAIKWKAKLSKKLEDPVVTEIVAVPVFYSAEEYHQDYYRKNPNEGYCNFVIRPKLKKLNLE
jgi:peptide-methionine (S)-S-oxide reductase